MYILLILLGISQIYGIKLINILIFIVIATMVCICPLKSDVVILFLLVPFFNLLSLELGTTSFYYIYILIYLFKYFRYRRWKIEKNKVIIIMIAIFFTMFWLNFAVQLKWLLLFILLVINYKDIFFINEFHAIVKHICISTILSSIIGYVMLIEGKSIYTHSYIYSSLGNTTRFPGLVGDSVFYGQFAVIIIAVLLTMLLENKVSKIFGYASTVILSCFVVITYSKTAIVLLAFVVLTYGIAYIGKYSQYSKTAWKTIVILGIFCLVTFSGFFYIITHLDNPLIKMYVIRFSSTDLWTGRKAVTDNYIQKLSSDFLYLFVGMPYSEYTQNGVLVGETIITRAHNIYLETMCLFGVIPAFVIVFLCVKKMFVFLMKNKNWFMIVPLLTLMISGVSLHGHIEWPYYFLVAICIGELDYQRLYKVKGDQQ